MGAPENKQLMQQAFDGLERGDTTLFVDALSDDVRWKIIGSTKFSKTFQGKQSVVNELLRPLGAQIEGKISITAERLIAEGDFVVWGVDSDLEVE